MITVTPVNSKECSLNDQSIYSTDLHHFNCLDLPVISLDVWVREIPIHFSGS